MLGWQLAAGSLRQTLCCSSALAQLLLLLPDSCPSARSPPPAAPVPAGRALDAAEHLLVKCRPLAQQWGTERFGLADPAVLQAIEVGCTDPG